MIDLRMFLASMTGTVASGGDASKPQGEAPARRRSFGESFERFILLIHRWIGIFACILFVSWFISGVVLAYVPWPTLDRTERLAVLKPLDWQKVTASPTEAMAALGLSEFPKDLRLEMSGDEPVYRAVGWDKKELVVSAVTGRERAPVSGQQALAIVSGQLGAPAATLEEADLHHDQWTVTSYSNKYRPFHRIALNDDAGTKFYVSVATGEIVLDTQRTERFWNWVGAIPHWLYFSAIRLDGARWTWIIYVVSTAGIFVALSGIWFGIRRIRVTQRYANGKRIPFAGWMRWHHIFGLIGGLFLSAWIITGLLIMYPGGFLEERSVKKPDISRFRGMQEASFPAVDFRALGEVAKDARRITFDYMAGSPILTLEYRGREAPTRVLDASTLQPVTFESPLYRQAAAALAPHAKLLSLDWIKNGDEYWHTGHYYKKLPIARAVFDDGEWFHIDPDAGAVVGVLDQEARVGRWTVIAMHDIDWHWLLQRRPWWDIVFFLAIIPGLAISITGLVIGIRRLRRTVEPKTSLPLADPDDASADGAVEVPAKISTRRVCVVHSSQTGTAEELVGQLQLALEQAGLEATRHDLVDVTPAMLAGEPLVLFVIATTGEGDPPDRATAFLRRHMRQPAPLGDMAYAVLALGDTEYPKYCQFGRQVDAWLAQSGALRLFRTGLVDKGDGATIDAWVQKLERSLDKALPLERTRTFAEWRLVSRRCMNDGSVGAPIFQVDLAPVEPGSTWLPGDIAQIEAGVDWATHQLGTPGTARDYSIASLPDEGHISLFVRLTHREDGTPGIGSGWLANAPIGTSLPLRVRANPGFHPSPGDRPAIFIGNGTGYAGLRAHLLHRVRQGQHRNWLVFGERNRASDYICRDEVDGFSGDGMLEACDLVFSRDQPERTYVQDVLRERGEALRRWVAEGAYIFVCGSQTGMAPGAHAALQEALGEDVLQQQLAESGRYRRDVY